MSDETKGRILVIDDDEAVRGAQLRILENAGFDARATHSAFSFLDSAGEWAPDIIMLDIAMPGVSGFDALKTLSRPEEQADVAAFFAERPIPQGAKQLAQILERQGVNVAMRQREAGTLTKAFS